MEDELTIFVIYAIVTFFISMILTSDIDTGGDDF